MKIVLLFLVGTALGSRRQYEVYLEENFEERFQEFMNTHNKHYDDEAEKQKRFDIFKSNLETINRLNSESKGVFGITKFIDLTDEEFINMYTGYKEGVGGSCESRSYMPGSTAPDSFDWRDRNVVSRVKNQGSCGSCWAFSTTGNLEALYAIKNGQSIEVSQQQLVDCDTNANGCQGGNIETPFVYWMDHGAELDNDYAYEDAQGQCRYDASRATIKVSGCISYNPSSEEELKNLLQETGPLSMSVDATPLKRYTNSVLMDCSYTIQNHAVLLVGYGTENGTPYWLVKNSYGEEFGEQGYFKMHRGVNCLSFMNNIFVTGVL